MSSSSDILVICMKIAFVMSVIALMVLAACSAGSNWDGYQVDSEIAVPSERTVSWEAAVQLLRSGKVNSIMQTHNLQVGLVLKDGTQLRTTEPAIDAIMREIQACGAQCEGMTIGTE